ncbi:hypothetical protein PLICRDRAFT_175111 [Plicaturopsis crispa FD-325 SS-3]|nr:hypothetical protein PLICRDRAFT_175111 [Plicaturopsis crispa FD-325 SS-3]
MPPPPLSSISSPSSLSYPSSLSVSSPLSSPFTPSSRATSFFSCMSSLSPPSSPPPLAPISLGSQSSDAASSYGTDDDLCAAMAAFDMSTVSHLIPPPSTPPRRACDMYAQVDKSVSSSRKAHVVAGVGVSDDEDDVFGTPTPTRAATPPESRSGRKHYVVLKGYCPGIYDKWHVAKPHVHGVPGAIFKSFRDLSRAQEYFRRALVNNDVEVLEPPSCRRSGSSGRHKWIVVFAGISPGVYPSWREAAPNVIGVAHNHCLGYPNEWEALAAYEAARRAGDVHGYCTSIMQSVLQTRKTRSGREFTPYASYSALPALQTSLHLGNLLASALREEDARFDRGEGDTEGQDVLVPSTPPPTPSNSFLSPPLPAPNPPTPAALSCEASDADAASDVPTFCSDLDDGDNNPTVCGTSDAKDSPGVPPLNGDADNQEKAAVALKTDRVAKGPNHQQRYNAQRRRAKRAQAREKANPFDYKPRSSLSRKAVKPLAVHTSFNAAKLHTAKSSFVGKPHMKYSKTPPTVEQLQARGYELVEWNGKDIRVVLDADGNIIAVFAGEADAVEWPHVINVATAGLRDARYEITPIIKPEDADHRRGKFFAIDAQTYFTARKNPAQRKPAEFESPKPSSLLFPLSLSSSPTSSASQHAATMPHPPQLHAGVSFWFFHLLATSGRSLHANCRTTPPHSAPQHIQSRANTHSPRPPPSTPPTPPPRCFHARANTLLPYPRTRLVSDARRHNTQASTPHSRQHPIALPAHPTARPADPHTASSPPPQCCLRTPRHRQLPPQRRQLPLQHPLRTPQQTAPHGAASAHHRAACAPHSAASFPHSAACAPRGVASFPHSAACTTQSRRHPTAPPADPTARPAHPTANSHGPASATRRAASSPCGTVCMPHGACVLSTARTAFS